MLQPLGMLHSRKFTILKDLKPMSWILFPWMKDREWGLVNECHCHLLSLPVVKRTCIGTCRIWAENFGSSFEPMCEWHLKYDAYFACAFDGWAPSIEVHVSAWEVLDLGRLVWSLNQCWVILDFANNIQFQF